MFNKSNKAVFAASIVGLLAVPIASTNAMLSQDKSPFAMTELNGGYMQIADSKCGEGKCGGSKKKEPEGKCGEGKCGGSKKKESEGKCGEGKCGGSKKKESEGKCGEGKCGGSKK